MKAQSIQQYDAPHQFEPLMPSDAAMAPLLERASDLARTCHALGAGQPLAHSLSCASCYAA